MACKCDVIFIGIVVGLTVFEVVHFSTLTLNPWAGYYLFEWEHNKIDTFLFANKKIKMKVDWREINKMKEKKRTKKSSIK